MSLFKGQSNIYEERITRPHATSFFIKEHSLYDPLMKNNP